MLVTTWAFTVHAKGILRNVLRNVRECIVMRGDNTSVFYLVYRCRRGREQRLVALIRMLGCLVMRSCWCVQAKDVRGVANVLTDGLSRWDRPTIARNLCASRHDILWLEQRLEARGVNLCTDIWAASTSEAQLRARLSARTGLVACVGQNFAG